MSKMIPFNSGDYQNKRHKQIADGLNKIKSGKLAKHEPNRHDPMEQLIHKAKTLSVAVQDQIKPILQAGGWKDKESLRATIATLFVQGLDNFSHDELVNLCTIFHMESMMESIEADPWATGKPDLLSGSE